MRNDLYPTSVPSGDVDDLIYQDDWFESER